jgi:hypothetical protein
MTSAVGESREIKLHFPIRGYAHTVIGASAMHSSWVFSLTKSKEAYSRVEDLELFCERNPRSAPRALLGESSGPRLCQRP